MGSWIGGRPEAVLIKFADVLADRRDHPAMVEVIPDRMVFAGIVEAVGPEVPGVGVEDLNRFSRR